MYLSWSRKWLSIHDNEVKIYEENNGNCIKSTFSYGKTTANKRKR